MQAISRTAPEVIVALRKGVQAASLAERYGATLVERFDTPPTVEGDWVRLRMEHAASMNEGMAWLAHDPRIQWVAPNDEYRLDEAPAATRVPNDLDKRLWALRNTAQEGGTKGADIDATRAWAITTGRREGGPVIAVLDSGADLTHPDLAANLWTNPGEIPGNGIDDDGNGVVDDVHGYNAFDNSGDPTDDHSHGTHVSGTIAAVGNNGQGVVGVNWEARVMPVKIFDRDGKSTVDAILRGLFYAQKMGARVTNSSWGGGRYNQALYEALKSFPALHVMACGNRRRDNDLEPHYPSSYELPNILAVAATDRNDALARFSNYGAESVDLAAPGVGILSTVPGGGYDTKSGTSMATPHVTGAAALVATVFPEASAEEIKARLMAGADPRPGLTHRVASGGRLNVANALETDQVPPEAVRGLRVESRAPRSVSLSWTAPGDDGANGRASGYELRWSDRPILDEATFAAATPLSIAPPAEAGRRETARVELVPHGRERQVYFALRARDNVGNRSPLASVVATVPAARVVFVDDFDGPDRGWTTSGTWAPVNVEGRGRVYTDSPDGRYPDRADTALTSPSVSLRGVKSAMLVFDAAYDLDEGQDGVWVQVSTDGRNWAPVASFTGQSPWRTHTLDLSPWDGKAVQVRFHLVSDGVRAGDGFSVDDVRILEAPLSADQEGGRVTEQA